MKFNPSAGSDVRLSLSWIQRPEDCPKEISGGTILRVIVWEVVGYSWVFLLDFCINFLNFDNREKLKR